MYILLLIALAALTGGVYFEAGPYTALAYGIQSTFILVVYTLATGFIKHIKQKQQNDVLGAIAKVTPVPKKDVEFRRYFNTNDRFQDQFISSITGRYMLDIMALEKFMISHHGYDPATGSLKNFIQDTFGQDARGFIEELLTFEKK
jgi:hypothetical protein